MYQIALRAVYTNTTLHTPHLMMMGRFEKGPSWFCLFVWNSEIYSEIGIHALYYVYHIYAYACSMAIHQSAQQTPREYVKWIFDFIYELYLMVPLALWPLAGSHCYAIEWECVSVRVHAIRISDNRYYLQTIPLLYIYWACCIIIDCDINKYKCWVSKSPQETGWPMLYLRCPKYMCVYVVCPMSYTPSLGHQSKSHFCCCIEHLWSLNIPRKESLCFPFLLQMHGVSMLQLPADIYLMCGIYIKQIYLSIYAQDCVDKYVYACVEWALKWFKLIWIAQPHCNISVSHWPWAILLSRSHVKRDKCDHLPKIC